MALRIVLGNSDRAGLFGPQTDEELASIDIDASIDRYNELTERLVREAYPDAEITTGPGTHIYADSSAQEQEAWTVVGNLCDEALNDHNAWIVER